MERARLVVGLGNPGEAYEWTRHNLGFLIIDHFLANHDITGRSVWKKKFGGLFLDLESVDAKLCKRLGAKYWLKPLTYMNLSGEAVGPCMHALKVSSAETLIVHDELDMDRHRIKLKQDGGHGGHNGLRSLLDHLASSDFWRLRVGVGRPEKDFPGNTADFLLEPLEPEQLQETVELATKSLQTVLRLGFNKAMQQVNRLAKTQEESVDGKV